MRRAVIEAHHLHLTHTDSNTRLTPIGRRYDLHFDSEFCILVSSAQHLLPKLYSNDSANEISASFRPLNLLTHNFGASPHE